MSASNHVKKVALVGATGNAGSQILQALLARNTFEITAISRKDSTASPPSGVTVKRGDYDSAEFLESTLRGQDALVITLSFTAQSSVQSNFIKAAAKAGVPWILPNEYGSDGAFDRLVETVPVMIPKRKHRQEIEQLGKSSWIGMCTNPWYDVGLQYKTYGIDVKNRKATIQDDGNTPFNATTLPQLGRAVAGLLSLPITSSSGPSLSDYKNKFVYINSFVITKNKMLAEVQEASKTRPEDWDVTHVSNKEYMQSGRDQMAKGDHAGLMTILYGATWEKGLGDFPHGPDGELANEKLGLKTEDLGEATRQIVSGILAT